MHIATRHQPVHVSGLEDLLVYTRRYPDRIEAWIKFKREDVAEKYNLPLRFLFGTYDTHTYQETQLRYAIRNAFQNAFQNLPPAVNSPTAIPDNGVKPQDRSQTEPRPVRRSPVKEAFARAEQRLKAAAEEPLPTSGSDHLVTDQFTGQLLQHGIAERHFDEVKDETHEASRGAKTFNQYQCKIADESLGGNVTQIWGWDLKRAIADAKAQVGSRVEIRESRRKGQKKKAFTVTVL